MIRITYLFSSALEGSPELLHFAPYDKDQLVTILFNKMPTITSHSVSFDDKAIQFCARKVSAVHGDLRKAVDICRRAAEITEGKGTDPNGTYATQQICSPLTYVCAAYVYCTHFTYRTYYTYYRAYVCMVLCIYVAFTQYTLYTHMEHTIHIVHNIYDAIHIVHNIRI